MSADATIAQALAASGLDAVDARALLAHVLGKDRTWLAAHASDAIAPDNVDAFLGLARRRREGEPIAYLVGTREFWGLPLIVTPAVLIPRPETETLVETVLRMIPSDCEARVLDLGTGSGAIALALAHERPAAHVLATDVSVQALEVARENARRLALSNVEFVQSDWLAAVPRLFHGGAFDLVASNPPYIAQADPHLAQGDLRYEPPFALSPGIDGLEALRRIVADARGHLVAGGALVVEHGYDQSEAVHALFVGSGYSDVIAARDLAGIARVVAGRRGRRTD